MTSATPDRRPTDHQGDRPAGRPAATLVVEAAGAALVQDLGRPGLAYLGVGTSGAADRGALRLANRLLANPPAAAGAEVLLGGLVLRAMGHVTVAVTGADVAVWAGGRSVPRAAPLTLRPGDLLELGAARAGLCAYVAVRGGLAVAAVLGSRSRDTLAGLGPEPLRVGDRLPVGPPPAAYPVLDAAPLPGGAPPVAPGHATAGESPFGRGGPEPVSIRVLPGPRLDRLLDGALSTLLTGPWQVAPASDRVGTRLIGPELRLRAAGELPSEGMVRGAIQVPPSGSPVILGPDHPVTGRYPVMAVILDADQDAVAQVRPGERLRFRLA